MKKRIIGFLSVFIFIFTCLSISVKADSWKIKRLYGSNRYETCSKIAEEGWNTSNYAVIVNGENFPDAMSASVLAKKYNAPILLTESEKLNSNTYSEINRLKVKTVFIVGGTGAVSASVENKLQDMKIQTKRFSGINRNATSVDVANQIGTSNGIILTIDDDYRDALSAAPIAAKLQMPIILVPKYNIPYSVMNFVKTRDIPKTFIIGDKDLISDNVSYGFPNVQRITGKDKFERNINIINTFKDRMNLDSIDLAYGDGFSDALSGSAFAALRGNPIALIGDSPAPATKNYILDKAPENIYVLGGTGVISEATLASLLGKNDHGEQSAENKGTSIIAAPTATVGQAKNWAKRRGGTELFIGLADIYWKIAPQAGVDPAVAYAQSAKETNFGKFTGVLNESFHNPCGLKNSSGGGDYDKNAHKIFSSWNEGIQAHVDHLALYAGVPGYPKSSTPDPRHFASLKGIAPTVEALGGKWAGSATYGTDIVKMMNELKAENSSYAPSDSNDNDSNNTSFSVDPQ